MTMNVTNALGKALDQANEQIDRMAGVSTTKEYSDSLTKVHCGQYLVRPDGSVEFIK